MNYKLLTPIIGLLLMLGAHSCTNKVNDEMKRNEHFVNCDETLYGGRYASDERFDVDTTFTDDNYYSISVSHKFFAFTSFTRLYSPTGKLLLIVAGCQEACEQSGYAIEYDGERISSVRMIAGLHDEIFWESEAKEADILQDFYTESLEKAPDFTFEYSEKDILCGIKEINSPQSSIHESIECSIDECPSFWSSDLDGGGLCFFVTFKSTDHTGSSVDYLYADGRLVAELAYWRGTFIKLRTYNIYGMLVGVYNNRNIDVKQQVIDDSYEMPQWYVE